MTGTAAAMAEVLMTWALLAAAFVGVGLLVRRALGFRSGGAEAAFDAFWIGWAAAIIFLQLWHLARPVNEWAALVVGAAAVVGWLVGARGKSHQPEAPAREGPRWRLGLVDRKAALVSAALFVPGLMVLARYALGPPTYDTGLYHLNAVRWLKTYAIVPGLGNLHGRLAYNNSSFLYDALLDLGPWAGRGRHLANGLLLAVLLARSALSLPRAFRAGDPLRPYHVLAGAFAAPVFVEAGHGILSGYNPDLPTFVLGAVLSLRLLRLLLEAKAPAPDRDRGEGLFFIGLLAVIGTTVKLSFAALGATSLLIAAAVLYRRGPVPVRATVATLGAVALAAVPWVVRGVVLSGYPAYPAAFGAMPVDWRVPPNELEEMRGVIAGWARDSSRPWREVVGGWEWLRPWWRRVSNDRGQLLVPLALLVPAAVLALLARRGQGRAGTGLAWLLLLPAGAGAAFWFLTAPDPRLAGASLWVLGAGSLTLAVEEAFRRKALGPLPGLVVLALCGAFPLVALADAVRGEDFPRGFVPTPAAQLQTLRTRSGLEVYVPAGSDDRSFDAPLPATAPNQFRPELRLRREGDLSSGFVMDGGSP
jgi:hypothetical protein